MARATKISNLSSFVVKAPQKLFYTHEFMKNWQSAFLVRNVVSLALTALFTAPSRGVIRTCRLITANRQSFVEDPAAIIHVMPKLEPFVKAACRILTSTLVTSLRHQHSNGGFHGLGFGHHYCNHRHER